MHRSCTCKRCEMLRRKRDGLQAMYARIQMIDQARGIPENALQEFLGLRRSTEGSRSNEAASGEPAAGPSAVGEKFEDEAVGGAGFPKPPKGDQHEGESDSNKLTGKEKLKATWYERREKMIQEKIWFDLNKGMPKPLPNHHHQCTDARYRWDGKIFTDLQTGKKKEHDCYDMVELEEQMNRMLLEAEESHADDEDDEIPDELTVPRKLETRDVEVIDAAIQAPVDILTCLLDPFLKLSRKCAPMENPIGAAKKATKQQMRNEKRRRERRRRRKLKEQRKFEEKGIPYFSDSDVSESEQRDCYHEGGPICTKCKALFEHVPYYVPEPIFEVDDEGECVGTRPNGGGDWCQCGKKK